MTDHYRKLALIHGLLFVLLLVTWLSGILITDHAGTPMVALYYVMHIFPGSIIFVLILFQWLISSQTRRTSITEESLPSRWTRILHRCYDAILVAVPLIGLLIFFEPASPNAKVNAEAGRLTQLMQLMQSQPFHRLHAWLYYLLLALVVFNVIVMLMGQRREH